MAWICEVSNAPGKYRIMGREMPDSEIVHLKDNILILKVPGHSFRVGLGVQGYAVAQFRIFRVRDIDDDGDFVADELASVDLKVGALSSGQIERVRERMKEKVEA